MKLNNPVLITLNNTLHIKADNLDAVEVDSSCVNEMNEYAYELWIPASYIILKDRFSFRKENPLNRGVNISEIADRIEVRDTCLVEGKPRAFLLPPKELTDTTIMLNKLDKLKESKVFECERNKTIWYHKSYTIEEIEKAIDEAIETWEHKHIKNIIINNLKK